MQQTTNRALFISDMDGLQNENSKVDVSYIDTTSLFLEGLGYQVDLMSSLALANIDPDMSNDERHPQFVEHGIETAVTKIVTNDIHYALAVGFSMGGTLLWKAVTRGFSVGGIVCISATRLRYESQATTPVPSVLIFGDSDPFAPSATKCQQLGGQLVTVNNSGHEFYKSGALIAVLNRGISLLNTPNNTNQVM